MGFYHVLLPALLLARGTAQSNGATCEVHADCYACTTSPSWAPWSHCGWCPNDGRCHEFLSAENPCSLSSIQKSGDCKVPAPAPVPSRPDPYSDWLKSVIAGLFKALHITDVDATQCADDIGRSAGFIKNFEGDMSSKRYSQALGDLSRGLYGLAASVSKCNVPEIQSKIDAFAASIRWANVTKIDGAVKILVDASELFVDLGDLASAIKDKDGSAADVGDKIGKLLNDWSAVTHGCSGDSASCKLIDGLLRMFQAEAESVAGCEEALKPALDDFTAAGAAFHGGDYQGAVSDFANGLDVMAKALAADSCGLKHIADTIGNLSPKLRAAVVKIESSKVVKIVVGSANVYDDLYAAATALQRGDYAGVGIQMAQLLAQLRASDCKSQACIVMDGILQSLQVGFTDLTACHNNIDETWDDISKTVSYAQQHKYSDSMTAMGKFFGAASNLVSVCGIPQFGPAFEQVAKALDPDSGDRIAAEIQEVVQVFVSGADVFADFQKIIQDSQAYRWASLGRDLGSLSDWISDTVHCHRFSCMLVEGLLQEADKVLTDLKPCMSELQQTESDFHSGIVAWASGQPKSALKSFSAGLSDLAHGVDACGIADQLKFIEQEANVLGLGNLTILEGVISVVVHGKDFAEEVGNGFSFFLDGDFREAAKQLGKAMNDLSNWTTGHLCTSPICYIVNGVLQYFQDLGKDLQSCKSDFQEEWMHFGKAFQELSGHEGLFQWSRSDQNISAGIGDLGSGLHALAKSVTDCHLAELADIIEKLAVKLGVAPEVSWIESLLHILINGVDIVDELAESCTDFSQHNYPGFGYHVIKLIQELFTQEELAAFQPHTAVEVYV